MRRVVLPSREDWQTAVEQDGLQWHTEGDVRCWNESAAYLFSQEEIKRIRQTAEEVHGLFQKAAAHVVKHQLWDRVGLRIEDAAIIKASWERHDWSFHGRFDFLLNEGGQPKLLEYNAETALSLVESAVIQKKWQMKVMPGAGQFNSLHESLVAAWRGSGFQHVHCAWRPRHPEVEGTIRYMAGIIREAGLQATMLPLHRMGWHQRDSCFVDADNLPIEGCYKIYPWEWMLHEPFARHVGNAHCRFVEPAWRLLHGSKGILTVLWELFPDHPALLPCYDRPDLLGASFVSKPMFGHEGHNVVICQNGVILQDAPGEYGKEPRVFQALVNAARHEGYLAQLGVWMVKDKAVSVGMRESLDPIIMNNSSIVPHAIMPEGS